MKVVSHFLLFLLLFVSGAIAVGYYQTVKKPLPSYDADIVLPELSEPVSILWDDEGVPRIDAANEADLYTAVGYVHAQERLWQMTLFQWMMEGRFAEFLGPEMVDTDIHQRTLGFWETAGRIAAETDGAMIERLQAYANGVNRYVSDHRGALPPEFSLLGVEPLEWTPQHSIGMTRLMAWDQNMQWRSELLFAELRDLLGAERLELLMPVYPEEAPVSVADSLWIGDAGWFVPGGGLEAPGMGNKVVAMADLHDLHDVRGKGMNGAEIGVGAMDDVDDVRGKGMRSVEVGVGANVAEGSKKPSIVALAQSFASQEMAIRKMFGRNGSVQGSNVWAVSGSRTKSGRPILAGDPHMGLFAPGFWFELTLHTPDLMVSGASIPGAPFVILGSNRDVAWSITNSMADDTDLFLEQFHPEDPLRVLRGGNGLRGRGASPINPNRNTMNKNSMGTARGAEVDADLDALGEWREVMVRYEVLAVKGEADRLVEILATEHGPLLGKARVDAGWYEGEMGGERDRQHEGEMGGERGVPPEDEMMGEMMDERDGRNEGMGANVAVPDGMGLALRWAGHDVSHELQSFYELQFARSVEEVREALRHFGSPVMTFGVADAGGSIALVTAGRVPVRSGDAVAIREGWDAGQDWRGWVGTDALPFLMDPPEGFVATANNRLHGEAYPHYVGRFWAPPYRIERIREVLGAGEEMTVEDMGALQSDVFSVQAREWMPRMLPVVQARVAETDSQLVGYLENWTFEMEGASTAASIFERWVWELSRGVFLRWMDEETYGRLVELPQHPVLMLRRLLMEGDGLAVSGLDGDGLDREIFSAFQRSVLWLRETFGDNPADWQWKNVHKVSFRPPLFAEAANQEGASTLLKLMVQNLLTIGPYEAEGNAITVNNTEYDWRNPYDVTIGASVRRVVDFGEVDAGGTNFSGTDAVGTISGGTISGESNASESPMPVTYSILPTGQSGNPFSNYFGNQTVRWLLGDAREIITDEQRLRSAGAPEMRLMPNE